MSKKDSKKSVLTLHPERCKGCRFCIPTCPKDAISVSEKINQKGYKPVIVDMETCIGCGSCYTICPDYVFEIKEVQ